MRQLMSIDWSKPQSLLLRRGEGHSSRTQRLGCVCGRRQGFGCRAKVRFQSSVGALAGENVSSPRDRAGND